jgi:hypothetical protein
MSGGDYVLGLLTIITGLAISDMIVSLHGLLVNRRHVTWDWLPLLAASCVLLLIISTWRITFLAFHGATMGPPIWVFLMILVQNIGLYLAACAAIPDRVPVGKPLDLRAHYDDIGRYFWSAIALAYAMFLTLSALEPIVLGSLQFPAAFFHALVWFPVIVAMVIWPKRKLHRLVVPLYFIWLCARLLPARLLLA